MKTASVRRYWQSKKARVNGINDLFAMFDGRYQTLQAQCLADPECSLEQAREKLLNEMGRESTPSNKKYPRIIFMPVTVILWGTGSARR